MRCEACVETNKLQKQIDYIKKPPMLNVPDTIERVENRIARLKQNCTCPPKEADNG